MSPHSVECGMSRRPFSRDGGRRGTLGCFRIWIRLFWDEDV